MTRQRTYFTNTIFFATCLTLGCTSGGALGCGSSGSSEEPATVDSALPGIYAITSYRASKTSCEDPPEADLPPKLLVFYPFHPNTAPDESRLGAAFCAAAVSCRNLAEFAADPGAGYSFLTGDDQTGWTGYAVPVLRPMNDECETEVQIHQLTFPSDGAIRIETQTVATTFKPQLIDTNATCRVSEAIAAATRPGLECTQIIILDATRDADL
ncbi:MAG: hypothetical protein WCE62_11340 [Polyangiales bacterium]